MVLDAIARVFAGEMPRDAAALQGGVDDSARADLMLTMFADGTPQTRAIDGLARRVSWVGRLPGATKLRRWMLGLYPLAVADLTRTLAREHARERVDLLVSTSSAAIHAVRAPQGVAHVCYVHAPARYIWSRGGDYGRGGAVGRLRGAGLTLVRGWFKSWDRRTANGPGSPDLLLANSSHTQDQIRACWGCDSIVLHPPVRTGVFTPDATVARDGSWLYVGALEPYKRVDIAILAAGIAKARLVVIGKGTQDVRLRALANRVAPGLVEFRGRVDDAGVIEAMRRARVLVFPQVEDFGIVAAEALACGTPVVARGAGGARDIVQDGVNGALFADGADDEAMVRAMVDAVGRAPEPGAAAIRASAMQFSEEAFARGFAAAIARVALSARR